MHEYEKWFLNTNFGCFPVYIFFESLRNNVDSGTPNSFANSTEIYHY